MARTSPKRSLEVPRRPTSDGYGSSGVGISCRYGVVHYFGLLIATPLDDGFAAGNLGWSTTLW